MRLTEIFFKPFSHAEERAAKLELMKIASFKLVLKQEAATLRACSKPLGNWDALFHSAVSIQPAKGLSEISVCSSRSEDHGSRCGRVSPTRHASGYAAFMWFNVERMLDARAKLKEERLLGTPRSSIHSCEKRQAPKTNAFHTCMRRCSKSARYERQNRKAAGVFSSRFAFWGAWRKTLAKLDLRAKSVLEICL
jgi:hypothetical protein